MNTASSRRTLVSYHVGCFASTRRHCELLSLNQSAHFDAQFFLTPAVGPEEEAPCSIVRHRLVGDVWMERLIVTNHLHETSRLRLALDVDTDFADLFEVKDGLVAARDVTCHHDDAYLTLSYARGDFRRSVTVAASSPAAVTRHGFAFTLELAHGEQWSVDFAVSPHAAQPGITFARRAPRGGLEDQQKARYAELETWLAEAPALEAADPALTRTYRASLSDLGALRMRPDLDKHATLPAAGLPWFMALFGRDSLITSFQALPYLPGLAATTLRVLAARQAEARDDFQEQEPGKILHELRFGELTSRRERPHSPYFGSADATPLFLILLDEYHLWSGDDSLVRELEPNARAALAWIADSGDRDGDGYVEYERRNATTGLVNQCWKDSWNSIQFADGRLAQGPIATCEIQGYVYDAQRRSARLAREVWGDDGARRAARAACRRPPRRLPARLLGPRARLLRPRSRRQQTASRQPDLQRRAPAVVGNPRRPRGCHHRRAVTQRGAVLRLGSPDPRHTRGGIQPTRLPHRDGLAARQLADRRRARQIRTP